MKLDILNVLLRVLLRKGIINKEDMVLELDKIKSEELELDKIKSEEIGAEKTANGK